MPIQILIRSSLFAFVMALLFSVGLAEAQLTELVDESRDEAELRVEIKDAIARDTDLSNTVLVFNNAGRRTTYVHCAAYNGNGRVLGRRIARVPAQGVRYLRASDLSNGVDFVGSVICKAREHVVASAIFLTPGAITNLEVVQKRSRRATRIRFPLVASF